MRAAAEPAERRHRRGEENGGGVAEIQREKRFGVDAGRKASIERGDDRAHDHHERRRIEQQPEHAGREDAMHRERLAERQLEARRDALAEAERHRLHPALDPAAALRQPLAERHRRLLVGARIDGGALIAETCEPDAEVRVLRHVERIPRPDLLKDSARKMVRRAAERERRAPRGKRRQKHLEIRRVFDGEHAREPAPLVVGDKPRLHAAEVRPLAERRSGPAQLVALRPVLRVEDDDEIAARKGERVGERLRLGARPAGRHDDHLELRPGDRSRHRRARLQIVLLDDQEYLQLALRVVESSEVF